MSLVDWLSENYQWFFGGVGGSLVLGILSWMIKPIRKRIKQICRKFGRKQLVEPQKSAPDLDELKSSIHVLFIDDDVRFKVVRILQDSGWIHTRMVKDIESLDQDIVLKTDVFFVDVQGVGRALGFRDEGLGLARALKERFPSKKVVIYSAETQGERFHEALRRADDFLAKNADPYQFQKSLEELSRKVWKTK